MEGPIYRGRALPVATKHEVSDNVRVAYNAFNKVVNTMDERGAHQLASLLANDHRTLVQSTMREFVLPFLYWLRHDFEAGFFDARNADATKLAAILVTATEESNLGLPFI